jgi:tetratricopeptide (TPR) repeat protein
MMLRVVMTTAVISISGCAYYNGLWRANRLAGEAEQAGRDGRIGEARSLWSQAATRAESVVVRHPKSRWTDDALVLQGRALRELGRCGPAVEPLERARTTSPDAGLREEAAVLAAACAFDLGDPAQAQRLATEAVASQDDERASRARYWRGLATRALGDHRGAERDFATSVEPGAAIGRAASLVALGETQAARPILDSLLEAGATEEAWATLVTALAQSEPAAASRVLANLGTAPGELDDGARARLHLAAGEAAVKHGDSASAREWWSTAATQWADSVPGREAAIALATLDLARASSKSMLEPIADRLDTLAAAGGRGAQGAAKLSVLARRIAAPADEPGLLLLQAEVARDSLNASALAANLLFEVAVRWPESLFVPKAMLGAAALRASARDSLVDLVTRRYPGSPYVLALAGRAPAAFQALEDSLLTLSGAARPAALRAADPRRAPIVPGPKWVPLPNNASTRRR